MKKLRKFRLYDKYNEDLWGALMYKRTYRWIKVLLKMLYRKRLLFGDKWKEMIDVVKAKKFRKGFGKHHSVYKSQLWSKQKLQFFYHFHRDYQLKKFVWAVKRQKGIAYDNFAGLLESRVLTILYRAGLLTSMRSGAQLIVHHGIVIDGKRVNKPNFTLQPGQMVHLKISDCRRLAKLRKKLAPSFPASNGKYIWDLFGRIREKKEEPLKWNGKGKWRKDRKQKKRFKRPREFLFYKTFYFKLLRRLQFHYILSQRGSKKLYEKKRMVIPSYLEVSYKLRKIMLVYRPKAREVFYPFKVHLGEVLAHYG